MIAVQDPPVNSKVVNSDGIVTPIWLSWFQSMLIVANSFSVSQAVSFTNLGRISTRDFGKLIKFANGGAEANCYLPSVGAVDIGAKLSILRLGTGPIYIYAADSDRIGNSSAGGGIACLEAREGSNVMLFLTSATKWSISGGLGIWYVF